MSDYTDENNRMRKTFKLIFCVAVLLTLNGAMRKAVPCEKVLRIQCEM